MSDGNTQPIPEKARPRIVRVALLPLGLMLVLYFLSEGPAYRLFRKGVISQTNFVSFYSPVFHFRDRYHWCDKIVFRYENLWYNEAKEMSKALRDELLKEGYKEVK